jgi:hypothetical protein
MSSQQQQSRQGQQLQVAGRAQQQPVASSGLPLPSADTLVKAMKLSLKLAKPLDFYFYEESCRDGICIMHDGEDMVIYKNDDERTSPISKTFKSEEQFIVITENTIYIISASTPIRNLEEDA